MNFLKTALFTLMILVPSSTSPFQGFNQKTKKYVKAALYGVAALGSSYLAYCCLRDLCNAKPQPADFNTKKVVTAIKEQIDQAKFEGKKETDQPQSKYEKITAEYSDGLEKGKEIVMPIILDHGSYQAVNISKAIEDIRVKRNTTIDSTSNRNEKIGIAQSVTIAANELDKYKPSSSSYSPKDILGVVVGSCGTIHFGYNALRCLTPGDSLDLSVSPQVINGTVQSSIRAGITINR
jgi:hypothetical protein